MEWLKLLSQHPDFVNDQRADRTAFDRDYDRIIFSHPFRRLQDKTQVHPLPEEDFVHTRLTHSLEVSSVGRSLGRLVGAHVIDRHPMLREQFSPHDFGAIVAAASLAHDIGNPPFGHSGESAISGFFEDHSAGREILKGLSITQQKDLTNFEGNAQGFRLLNKAERQGLQLTMPTLAAFTKYPRPSHIQSVDRSRRSQKKYGFYASENSLYQSIADHLGLKILGEQQWCRHPLAFLVEAADDICYHIIDLEDGCNLGLVSFEETRALYAAVLQEKFKPEKLDKIRSYQEKTGVLRALSISVLIDQCVQLFLDHETEILQGNFDHALTDQIPAKKALDNFIKVSVEKIYRSSGVTATEAAGFEVIGGLLETFVPAAIQLAEGKITNRNKAFSRLLPIDTQTEVKEAENTYDVLRVLLDHISGMTDSSAINLYRKVKGITLPGVR